MTHYLTLLDYDLVFNRAEQRMVGTFGKYRTESQKKGRLLRDGPFGERLNYR